MHTGRYNFLHRGRGPLEPFDDSVPQLLTDAGVRRPAYRQDWVNRRYLADEADHLQTLTFDAGLHFLDINHAEDGWFAQIETFDPHEPFSDDAEGFPSDGEGRSAPWSSRRSSSTATQ
ncbi:hypothetical protein [Nonomuraea jabiensis]|uniref:hypothetical protein n=1 Tax=Nonomuraea jabiensis TaxID=882448 RepID=UPI003D70EB58